MSKTTRILTGMAALLLLAAFVLPLWRIELVAPQYPEGLGLSIRLSSITGLYEPTDLENINALNHYIGMASIRPESIPELRFMPMILVTLVALGLGAAVAGRIALLGTWLGALGIAGIAGLVDFWKWGYEYGHNLDPEAPIRVPGMAYSPPIFGTKQLLNFVATSWPDSGAIVIGLAGALGVAALILALRERRLTAAG